MPQADLLTRSATADADLILRAATIDAPSFNEASRTVRVTFSTGAAVQRRDAQGPYAEVLSLADGHVDLSRMDGAPVLDSHRSHALEHVLGAVTQAGVENGQGWADIKFSSRAEVAPFMQDVKDGVTRRCSSVA